MNTPNPSPERWLSDVAEEATMFLETSEATDIRAEVEVNLRGIANVSDETYAHFAKNKLSRIFAEKGLLPPDLL